MLVNHQNLTAAGCEMTEFENPHKEMFFPLSKFYTVCHKFRSYRCHHKPYGYTL